MATEALDLGSSGLWLDKAVGHHVEGDLDAAEAAALTAKIKAYVGVTWILLGEAHERRADKALGYDSWADYVKAEFDMSRAHAYRLVAHAQAVYELAGAAGISDVSPMGDIPERNTRDIDVPTVAEEVAAATSALGDDASEEERADVLRAALQRHASSSSEPDADDDDEDEDEAQPEASPASREPETREQRDAREAEERRVGRNVAFGKYLIGLWALLGDGEKPVQQLLEGWVPDECPMWLVDAHKPVFTADGIRAVAAVMEKLASEWETRV